MRISELSRQSGVPVPTIKYYLREGLLPSGAAHSSNQADYDNEHLRRLRLIRALVEVGGLSIAHVVQTLAAVDDTSTTMHDAFGVAQDALSPVKRSETTMIDPDRLAARQEVERWLRKRRWKIRPEAMAKAELAETLVAMQHFGWGSSATTFDGIADRAFEQAASEVAFMDPLLNRGDLMEQAVVGTVVFEQAYGAIRRLALEHHSRLRFGRRR